MVGSSITIADHESNGDSGWETIQEQKELAEEPVLLLKPWVGLLRNRSISYNHRYCYVRPQFSWYCTKM